MPLVTQDPRGRVPVVVDRVFVAFRDGNDEVAGAHCGVVG